MFDWTLIGVWVAAVAMLATALFTWLAYQQARTVSGRHKPISIKPSKGREAWVTYPLSTYDSE